VFQISPSDLLQMLTKSRNSPKLAAHLGQNPLGFDTFDAFKCTPASSNSTIALALANA
jgi:hypothetical protein